MSVRRNFSVFIATLFLVSAFIISSVNAQQQSGSGLQMSPTRTEVMVMNPGEQRDFTITLKNITEGNITARAVLNDFKSDGVSGTPIIIDQSERTPYTLNNMLSGLGDVQLGPGETKEVKISVDTPGDAVPGAYFGAVRYVVIPEGSNESDRQIALNASVAHLVFVKVPGDVVEQIKIESLNIQKDDKAGRIFISKPNSAALQIKNLGNGFSEPFGDVSVTNMFGKEVDKYSVNNSENAQRSMVLPNSSRLFTNEIGGISMPGKYSVTASVAYGDGAEVVSYKSTFWYIPAWLIAVIGLILLLIAGLVLRIVLRKSKKK